MGEDDLERGGERRTKVALEEAASEAAAMECPNAMLAEGG
jgi:hypothetical protein